MYRGDEPSPKGLGYCASATVVGTVRNGKDKKSWTVVMDASGRKSWRRTPKYAPVEPAGADSPGNVFRKLYAMIKAKKSSATKSKPADSDGKESASDVARAKATTKKSASKSKAATVAAKAKSVAAKAKKAAAKPKKAASKKAPATKPSKRKSTKKT